MTISLDQVGKRHGATAALSGISLDIAGGEFLALVGPSGSGKTTLLRLIAGLERDYDGTIRIGGTDVAPIPARERRIGFVFQNYALFRHMTAAENVAFGLRVRPRATRPPADAIRHRVAELLGMVQLEAYAARYPHQLSGGQRQRVALARALAIDPQVLLLDEPLGALDPPIRVELRAMLRALHQRFGLTTLLVTHDIGEAAELSDRIAVLRAGRIEQVGTAATLDAQPANAFVFGFLGDSIALPGPGNTQALLRPDEIGLLPGDGPALIAAIHPGVRQTRYTVHYDSHRFDVILRGPPSLEIGTRCTLDLSSARLIPSGG
jgi:sulfate transport system ATP-binding protein